MSDFRMGEYVVKVILMHVRTAMVDLIRVSTHYIVTCKYVVVVDFGMDEYTVIEVLIRLNT